MKIQKVVYLQDCEYSPRDGGNSQRYMGEVAWQVGEAFSGEFMIGKVTDIYRSPYDEIVVAVDGKIALSIPYHAVQRIYYGDE